MATIDDFKITMHNDISIDDSDIYAQHTAYINNGNYSDATSVIADNDIDGVTASLLNGFENKISSLDTLIVDKEYFSSTIISDTEPTEDEFAGKTVWGMLY